MILRELEGTPITDEKDLELYKKYINSYRSIFLYTLKMALTIPLKNLGEKFTYNKPNRAIIAGVNISGINVPVTNNNNREYTIVDSFKNYILNGDLMDLVLYSTLCKSDDLKISNNNKTNVILTYNSSISSKSRDNIRISQFKKDTTLLDLLKRVDSFDRKSFEKMYITEYIDKLYNSVKYSFDNRSYLDKFKPMIISDSYF